MYRQQRMSVLTIALFLSTALFAYLYTAGCGDEDPFTPPPAGSSRASLSVTGSATPYTIEATDNQITGHTTVMVQHNNYKYASVRILVEEGDVHFELGLAIPVPAQFPHSYDIEIEPLMSIVGSPKTVASLYLMTEDWQGFASSADSYETLPGAVVGTATLTTLGLTHMSGSFEFTVSNIPSFNCEISGTHCTRFVQAGTFQITD